METTAKNSFVVKAVSVWLSFVMILTSFSGYSTSRTPLPSKTVAQHTGEEYFRAIFFKQGELANKIYAGELAEISKGNYTESEKNDVAEIQNMVLQNMMKSNPSFLNDFKKGIESSDIKTVEGTVNAAAKQLADELTKIDKRLLQDNQVYQRFLEASSESDPAKLGTCIILYLAPFIYYQIILYVMPMSIIVLAGGIEKDQQSQLYKEQFIYNIYEL